MYTEFISEFDTLFGQDRLVRDEPLKSHTTWKVGGPADLFFIAKSKGEIEKVVELVKKHTVPFFILGGGANVLVGDKGFRGLVIKNQEEWMQVLDGGIVDWEDHSTGEARHTSVHYTFYDDDKDPNYHADQVFVEVAAGYSMPHFIRNMFNQGITGLEWFARIPGTLGGWIYNNVHGHTIFIGDFVHSVRILTESGKIVEKSWKDLDFGYDYSIFHTNRDIILSAKMRFFRGNVEMAKEIYKDVLVKKNLRQPGNSAGCVFHNVSEEDRVRNNFESNAIGYIIDKQLHLNGKYKVGGAWISEKHGNFIETDGTATAQDILDVMEFMKKECREKFSIELKDEIFHIGEF
jgi:UDP-N-acetylmuramate dehydrogenase